MNCTQRVKDYEARIHLGLLRLRSPFKELHKDVYNLLLYHTDDVMCDECANSSTLGYCMFLDEKICDISYRYRIPVSCGAHITVFRIELVWFQNNFPFVVEILFMGNVVWVCPPMSPLTECHAPWYDNPKKGMTQCKYGERFAFEFRERGKTQSTLFYEDECYLKMRLKIFLKWKHSFAPLFHSILGSRYSCPRILWNALLKEVALPL